VRIRVAENPDDAIFGLAVLVVAKLDTHGQLPR
jgi:hypothetical protein